MCAYANCSYLSSLGRTSSSCCRSRVANIGVGCARLRPDPTPDSPTSDRCSERPALHTSGRPLEETTMGHAVLFVRPIRWRKIQRCRMSSFVSPHTSAECARLVDPPRIAFWRRSSVLTRCERFKRYELSGASCPPALDNLPGWGGGGVSRTIIRVSNLGIVEVPLTERCCCDGPLGDSAC